MSPSGKTESRSALETILQGKDSPYVDYQTQDLWLVLLHHTGYMNRTLLKLASEQPVEDEEMTKLIKHTGNCMEVITELQKRDVL